MTVAKKSINNEQNHDLFPGVLQGVAGESDLAYLASIAVVDDDRIGGDAADHASRVGNGLCFQLHSAFYLFMVWEGLVICRKKVFYDGNSQSTRNEDVAGG